MDKDILKQTWKSIQDLYELLYLSRAAAAAASNPLSRLKWIDGGTTTPAANANGAIGTPYSSFSNFLTAIGVGTSAADSSQPIVGMCSPALNGYTENLVVPSRRNVLLKGQAFAAATLSSIITGNATWNNSVAGGGVAPSVFASFGLVDLVLSGNFTLTDDGTTASELFFTSTVLGGLNPLIGGNLVATGATALAAANFSGSGVAGALTSTANATGCAVTGLGSTFGGAVVAKSVTGIGGLFLGNITVGSAAAGGSVTTFLGSTFKNSPVLTGGAGTIVTFDGDAWNSFRENGGTLVTCIAVAVGGYNGAAIPGAALSAANGINTNVSVGINGTGASAAFVSGGNWYTCPTATLTGNRTVTLLTGAGEKAGDTILISRVDATANTLTVVNGGIGGGNVGVLPVNLKGSILAAFDGTNWGLAQGGSDFT
jgi:hypothetical protein